MNTKPKARKFRIRRGGSLSAGSAGAQQMPPTAMPEDEIDDDGFGPGKFPTAAGAGQKAGEDNAPPAQATAPGAPSAASEQEEIEAIRREGLTGRQLRLARRMAQKHGLPATSDLDAVRRLRRAGIDPFQRANMLELVVADPNGGDGAGAGAGLPARRESDIHLPQTVKEAPVPSTELNPASDHLAEVLRIQREIARRRRKKLVLTAVRLAFFIGLPTFLSGFYFYRVATPLYATDAEFVIQKANPEASAGNPLGGLFAGTQFANSQDSISVQSYLESRDAMRRLNREENFAKAFEGPDIDPIQRLPEDATQDDAYRIYQRNIQVGYDPSEGMVKLKVIAPTPEDSLRFNRALISYAEQQVDNMTRRVREDQMTGARESYEEAEKKLSAAQDKVVELQNKYKVLSSSVEVQLITTQIGTLDQQLTDQKLTLAQIESNPNPTPGRVRPLKLRIKSIEDQIAQLRSRLTRGGADQVSLAEVQSQLQAAEAEVQTRQLMLSQALQALDSARIEANRQVRYLSLSVSPVLPVGPSYPKPFENTVVAFLIFCGIYLMLSMTASILREQVSA